MNGKHIKNSIALFCVLNMPCVIAHTERELIAKGRTMIEEVWRDGEKYECLDGSEIIYEDENWISWTRDGFFDHFVTNGWSRADCEAAFRKYLACISTNDMSTANFEDKKLARIALSQCENIRFTEGVSELRNIAFNPTTPDRCLVMDMAVRFGGVDNESASFVEAVVTNTANFTYADITLAIPSYCSKLLAVNTNDAATVAIRDRGVRLFYANRFSWPDWCSLDNLFVGTLSGYDYSSNRLDYASYVLSVTTNNYWQAMHDHFASVTNDLISSGRPLIELSVPSPE